MRPCRMPAVLMWMALLGSAADVASAQEQRVAVFGEIAAVDAHGPESGYGNMAMHGGELLVHVRGTVYAGLDVQAGRISWTEAHQGSPLSKIVTTAREFRQTSVTASVLREWPIASRVRGLAGGGVGCLFQHFRNVDYSDMVPWGSDYKPLVLQARGGIIGTVTEHLRFRAEVTGTFKYLLPFLGARVGIGYVF